ncbi:MAG: HPr Serine kinase C-terminal domain [Actinomycetota bacterium]|jgi:hypothetical protein
MHATVLDTEISCLSFAGVSVSVDAPHDVLAMVHREFGPAPPESSLVAAWRVVVRYEPDPEACARGVLQAEEHLLIANDLGANRVLWGGPGGAAVRVYEGGVGFSQSRDGSTLVVVRDHAAAVWVVRSEICAAVMTSLAAASWTVLHAGVVASDSGRGVVIAGPKGAGKSTTSLLAWHFGYRLLTDEACFFTERDVRRVHGLHRRPAVSASTARAYGFDDLRLGPQLLGKRLVNLECDPVGDCWLEAVIFPRFEEGGSAAFDLMSPEASDDALQTVLTSAPSDATSALDALIAAVPFYTWRYGRDLPQNAEALRTELGEIVGPPKEPR